MSLAAPGSNDPVFGAIWMSARISTDRDERTVTIREVEVKSVRFPDTSKEPQQQRQQQLRQVLMEQIPKLNVTFALDELMTSLDLARREKVGAAQLQNTPPHIIFSFEPATLILLDGAPKLQQLDQPNVMRVANTPFILLRDGDSNRYFLKTGETWASAQDINGPWENSVAPPPGITAAAAKLTAPPQSTEPADPNAPAQPAAPAAPATQPAAPGRIIVATEPTELIVVAGQPTYAPISSGDLLYVTNTQSNVFLDVPTQQTYVLFSGRWFHSKSLQGPWEYVAADQLPAAFAAIPPDSVKADVLTFVGGTTEAKEAVLDASIPQTTSIRRDAGANLKVDYDGEPKFQPIEGTSLTYAANASDPVVQSSGTYYYCTNGAWYESASPNGPWTVCTSVPNQIYEIPPSSPLYNCTYVRVYDHDETSVLCGYLPGYTGCYVNGPTIVYGTGYTCPGWYGTYYIPCQSTYGYGAYYDYWAGTWDFGFGCLWNPFWIIRDRFHHHHFFGPGGFRHHWHDWHGWDGGHFDHRRDFRGEGINIYHRPANMQRNVEMRGGERRFDVRGGSPRNNVFAGRDGRVYRMTDHGWEQRDNGGWSRVRTIPESRPPAEQPVNRPAPQRMPVAAPPRGGGVEADHFARQRGDFRAGGFRGDGGGMQPGGGGRGDGGGGTQPGSGGRGGGGGGGRR